MYRRMLLLCLLLSACTAHTDPPDTAQPDNVMRWDVRQNLDPTYQMVYRALEKNKFFVIFEPNIGRNLTGFAARWGEDYNRNQLQGIRAMVFCNPWYTNQVSNLDPDMLALCPLHLTLYQKGDTTSVLFVRPSRVAEGSPAQALLQEIEATIDTAVREAIALAGQTRVPGPVPPPVPLPPSVPAPAPAPVPAQ